MIDVVTAQMPGSLRQSVLFLYRSRWCVVDFIDASSIDFIWMVLDYLSFEYYIRGGGDASQWSHQCPPHTSPEFSVRCLLFADLHDR